MFVLGPLFRVSPRGELHLSANFVPFLPLLAPVQMLPVLVSAPSLLLLVLPPFPTLKPHVSTSSLFPPLAGADVPPAVADTVPGLTPRSIGLPQGWLRLYGRTQPLLANCRSPWM